MDLGEEGIKYLESSSVLRRFYVTSYCYHEMLRKQRWGDNDATLTGIGRFTVQHTAKLTTWSVCIMMFSSFAMILVREESKCFECFVVICVTPPSLESGTVGLKIVVCEMAKKKED